MKNEIKRAIKLIQNARSRSLIGSFGQQEVEYKDVKELFDEAIDILQKLIVDPITK